MGADTVSLARQRLTHSRLALQAQMNRGKVRRASPIETSREDDATLLNESPSNPSGYWAIVKGAARNWWHHHPACTIAAIAEPSLTRYAKRRPLHLLGVAAAVGAAAVVIRPWRLVSMGALLAAGLRASDIASTATQLLAYRFTDRHQDTTTASHERTSS